MDYMLNGSNIQIMIEFNEKNTREERMREYVSAMSGRPEKEKGGDPDDVS